MKKLYAGLIFGIFMMSSFLAINLYTGTSFPGYGSNETCNNCHNQPAFAKSVDTNFVLGDWANSQKVFDDNALWSTDYVPVINVTNRGQGQEFVRTQFLTNSTDFMMMMEIDDNTPTGTANTSATADKFAVIFNINSVNFTVGDFLTSYVSTGVINGQMGLKDGEADLWWIDTSVTGVNTTGTAMDYYITSNYVTDGAAHQDVKFALWYGILAVHQAPVWGYRLWFVRSLTDNDPNDVQFSAGNSVRYAIATWNDTTAEFHESSFDQMLIVGDQMAGKMTVTTSVTATATETKTITGSSTASAFTAVFVLAGLAASVPLISYYRRRKRLE